MINSDIRSYGKKPFFYVPNSTPIDPKAKIKQWKFSKPYKNWYLHLRGSNDVSRKVVDALRKEIGYWKNKRIDFLLAVFNWQPNFENYRQKYSKMNVYDIRNHHYVYSIPTLGSELKFFKSTAPLMPEENNAKTTAPLMPEEKKAETNNVAEYIYYQDYKMLYKELIYYHGKLITKLLRRKRELIKTKKHFLELIEETCYPEGLPDPIKQKRVQKKPASAPSDKKKAAFAPDFVPVGPRTNTDAVPVLANIEEIVPDKRTPPLSPDGPEPASVSEIAPSPPEPASVSDIEEIDRDKPTLPLSPDGPEPANVSGIALSPPVSPKRNNVSRKITTTPKKKRTRNRAIDRLKTHLKGASLRVHGGRRKRTRQR